MVGNGSNRGAPSSSSEWPESAANAAFRAAQVNRQLGRKGAIVGVSRRRLVSTGERPFARTAQVRAGPRRTDSQLPAGASARTRLASGTLYASSCEMSWLV